MIVPWFRVRAGSRSAGSPPHVLWEDIWRTGTRPRPRPGRRQLREEGVIIPVDPTGCPDPAWHAPGKPPLQESLKVAGQEGLHERAFVADDSVQIKVRADGGRTIEKLSSTLEALVLHRRRRRAPFVCKQDHDVLQRLGEQAFVYANNSKTPELATKRPPQWFRVSNVGEVERENEGQASAAFEETGGVGYKRQPDASGGVHLRAHSVRADQTCTVSLSAANDADERTAGRRSRHRQGIGPPRGSRSGSPVLARQLRRRPFLDTSPGRVPRLRTRSRASRHARPGSRSHEGIARRPCLAR